VSRPAGTGVREIESKDDITDRNACWKRDEYANVLYIHMKTFGVNSLTASVYIDWECLGLYVIDI